METKPEKLLVRLTEREVHERGQHLASLIAKLDEHTAHEAEVKEELKKTRSKLEREMRETADAIRNGQELRVIAVVEDCDWRTGIVTSRRADTGDVVRTRPVRDDERQLRLVNE